MRSRLRLLLLLSLAASAAFYVWQNFFAPKGGHISLPKALWLGLTVCCWLLLPPLVSTNQHIGRRLRRAYIWFWLPMLARALIELYLLYVSGGWRYAYGIGHDLFSAALLLWLWYACRRETDRIWVHTLPLLAAMFLAEAWFAHYISAFNNGLHHAELWFIGWEAPHLPNQIFTTACVLVVIGWLFYLERRT